MSIQSDNIIKADLFSNITFICGMVLDASVNVRGDQRIGRDEFIPELTVHSKC